MSIKTGEKYMVLKYPLSNNPELMKVEVTRVYENSKFGKIIEYREGSFHSKEYILAEKFLEILALEYSKGAVPITKGSQV